jgi:hypothetical protein
MTLAAVYPPTLDLILTMLSGVGCQGGTREGDGSHREGGTGQTVHGFTGCVHVLSPWRIVTLPALAERPCDFILVRTGSPTTCLGSKMLRGHYEADK